MVSALQTRITLRDGWLTTSRDMQRMANVKEWFEDNGLDWYEAEAFFRKEAAEIASQQGIEDQRAIDSMSFAMVIGYQGAYGVYANALKALNRERVL